MKMLKPIIIGSAILPVFRANSATEMARTPARMLPSALLNPLLNVAPSHVMPEILRSDNHLIFSCCSMYLTVTVYIMHSSLHARTNCIFEHDGNSEDRPDNAGAKNLIRLST